MDFLMPASSTASLARANGPYSSLLNTPLLVSEDTSEAEPWSHSYGANVGDGVRKSYDANEALCEALGESDDEASVGDGFARGQLLASQERASERVPGMAACDVNRLWDSPKLSSTVRWAIPTACVACACVLMSANLGLGAQVFAQIELGDRQAINTPSFFDFTLQNSVQVLVHL